MKKIAVKKSAQSVTPLQSGAKGLMAAGALAAAVGGVYLLMQPKKKAEPVSWILRAKADVMDELNKIPHVSQKAYFGIVKSVLKHYKNFKHISKEELDGLKQDLEGHWEQVLKGLKKD